MTSGPVQSSIPVSLQPHGRLPEDPCGRLAVTGCCEVNVEVKSCACLQTALKAVPQSPPKDRLVDPSVVDQPLTTQRPKIPLDNFLASPLMRPLETEAYHAPTHDDFMGEPCTLRGPLIEHPRRESVHHVLGL